MCILITFSISVLLIYILKWAKSVIFSESKTVYKTLSILIFIISVILTYVITTKYITVDYGFFGCIAPVFASILDMRGLNVPKCIARLDNIYLRILLFAVAITILALRSTSVQMWSLLSILILLTYNGKRGKLKLKYFFYVFYPMHLGLIYGIWYLIIHIIK